MMAGPDPFPDILPLGVIFLTALMLPYSTIFPSLYTAASPESICKLALLADYFM
jgi:hypothetical protein